MAAPRPGRFLALAWVVGKPGSILRLNWEVELREALDRLVFVADPRAEAFEIEPVRARFDELGRTARARYGWSRLAHALVVASPAVFVGVAVTVSERTGGTIDAALDAALPPSIVYVLVTMTFAAFCDRRARRSARDIRELDAPGVLWSRRIGADRTARRLVADAGRWSAGEQRRLQDVLWRFAEAERARSDYLESAIAFDEEAFAPLLRRSRPPRPTCARGRGTV